MSTYTGTLVDGSGNTYLPRAISPDVMTGCTSSLAGEAGLVPAPATGKQESFLRGDGTWQTPVVDGVAFNGSSAIHYGICSTAASTAAKTVSCTGFSLVTGSRITVLFSVTNTASNPTLNVNSTGAKAIWYNGSAINKDYLIAGKVYTFIYDGTQYRLENGDPAFDELVTQVSSLSTQVSNIASYIATYYNGVTPAYTSEETSSS